MSWASRPGLACSRRAFLLSIPAACLAAPATGKGRIVSFPAVSYADPSTEFPVVRLTDPSVSSRLPPYGARSIAKNGNSAIIASDASGRMEAYRLDFKSGQARQLTEAESLAPSSVTFTTDERSFCYLEGRTVISASLSSLRTREVYRAGEGFDATGALCVTDDALFAVLVERKGGHYRLRLVRMADGTASTLAEADEEILDPVPRPRRASVLYRRGGSVWLSNFDGQQNYRLRLADGEASEALWSPDGRTVLYLNYPVDSRKLRNIREFTPDANEDKAIADTSQFVAFERNSDGSVFVGASGSKASPYVLLLARAVKREFTLCEHRASDPRMVSPVFTANSQRVLFTSDRHGKPAIYGMQVEKMVSETESDEPRVYK